MLKGPIRAGKFQWIISRMAWAYVLVFVFALVCVDFKTLQMRIKTRHLNDAIPDFSDMIIFSKSPVKKSINWKPYKDYFELILKYIPNDLIASQMLGVVDYYSGQKEKAIGLLKNSSAINGHLLFWPNYNLGVIYYKEGKWREAAEYSLKAFTSNPPLTFLLTKDSIVYRQVFASPYFKYSLEDEFYDAQGRALILLLSSLYKMGQYDQVLAFANVGIMSDKLGYKDAFYFYAGLASYALGQWERSFILFQKSLTIEKNNPDVYYYIAGIYQNIHHLPQAKYYFEASLGLHQKNNPRFPYEEHTQLRFF